MKRREHNAFQSACVFLTLLTILFIGGNIAVIAFRGIRSLPECLHQRETLFAVYLSVKSACISSILCFVLSIAVSYVLTKTRLFCREAIEILLELTMSLPNIVLGLSMLILFSSPMGKALKGAGFPVVFNSSGIVLAQLVVNLPFAVKLTSTAFRGVDQKLERVAGLLGATQGKCFFTILLPLCKNALIHTGVVESLGGIWGNADAGGCHPHENGDTSCQYLSGCQHQRSGRRAGQRIHFAVDFRRLAWNRKPLCQSQQESEPI